MIKLIVCDMDGTLLNEEKKVSELTKNKIIEAQQKGAKFVIATGRSMHELGDVPELLQMDKYNGYLIASNGQRLYSFKDDSTVTGNKIPLAVCKQAFEISLDYHMCCYGQIDEKKFYYQPDTYVTTKSNRNRGMINYDEQSKFFTDNEDYDKLGFYCEDDKMPELFSRIGNEVEGDFDIYMVNATCLDIAGKDVNKVHGIKDICEELGIENDEVLVLGDGQNDLGMMTYFKYGVAMANSLDIVKSQVNYITDDNDHDGVAKAIDRFMMGENQ